MLRVSLLMLGALGTAAWAGSVAADQGDDFLRQYAETYRFRLGLPSSVEITPTGDAVLFLRSPNRSFVRDLYLFDPKTGEERRLLTSDDILGGVEEELTAEEKARRERMRLAARGIAGYSLSGDGNLILAPLSGRLFVVEWRTGGVRELEVLGGFPIDPRFSPDGTHVAYSAGGDLWSLPLATGKARRLTDDGGGLVSNGVPEFAAQEEMDRDQGYWFSPDGRHIAYQRNDDEALPVFTIADPSDPGKAPQSWRYPRAGTVNTDVRLGVVPTAGGDTVWVDWDRDAYPYLATVRWQADAPLTVLVQNRHQTEQVLYAVDPATGDLTELLTERDDAWLNLDQDMPHWLPGGRQFLWTTEREGAWQLELRDRDGSRTRALTEPGLGDAFSYVGLVHVGSDGRQMIVKGSESPLDVGLYRLSLEGESSPRRLTDAPGTHAATVSTDGSLRVVERQGADGRRSYAVQDGEGRAVGEIASRAEVPTFELTSRYETVGSDPTFHAVVLRPNDFDPAKRYPVIVHVYGGPHKQMVTRAGSGFYLDQWMANQGFIVVAIDGRGTPNRGREWERAIKHNFIDQPLADQVEVLKALGERYGEMDLDRVGIYGWSFGGYFSAMGVLRRPDVFRAAVAGAPVCDWEDYDTHYTERYIGLPQEQPDAYRVSNVTTYADRLKRPLLIIHGTADDNVYFTHALKMSNALFKAGKDHGFLTLSGQTHMVTDAVFVRRMYERTMAHFQKHLGAPEAR
ncbi:MAG: DPP IV N-terminal domain-containing protein [Acidobacteriota bacterium]